MGTATLQLMSVAKVCIYNRLLLARMDGKAHSLSAAYEACPVFVRLIGGKEALNRREVRP